MRTGSGSILNQLQTTSNTHTLTLVLCIARVNTPVTVTLFSRNAVALVRIENGNVIAVVLGLKAGPGNPGVPPQIELL